MSFIRQYFLGCDATGCKKQFGGPDAGDYDPEGFSGRPGEGEALLYQYLLEESRDMGWVELRYGNETAICCSPACGSKWLKEPRTN